MKGSVWNESDLHAEADYLHQALFGLPAPAAVSDRYVQLHGVCFPSPDPAERRTTERIIQSRMDAEAIECAFRLRKRKHMLTAKMHALLYLAEVRRNYYPLFFNEAPAPLTGKLRVIVAILRGACKAVQGEFLIRIHRLD
jgi:hypothetical protein